MFVKDITYPPAADVDPVRRAQWMRAVKAEPGMYYAPHSVLLQIRSGAQMWVSKEVSDDLQAADIDTDEIKFEETEWPHDRMEVYFQDPTIPTLLVSNVTNSELKAEVLSMLPRDTRGNEIRELMATHKVLNSDRVMQARMLQVLAENRKGELCAFTYMPSDMDRFAAGADLTSEDFPKCAATQMASDEQAEMRRLTVLFYKVLLLAGSEGHSVRRTHEKPTRAEGGKPGFKNRPSHERLIVEYLPRHRVERRKDAEAQGKKHQFLGRRGHWRKFRSDYFKNVQGMRKFIYPIAGPDGKPPKRKFILKTP